MTGPAKRLTQAELAALAAGLESLRTGMANTQIRYESLLVQHEQTRQELDRLQLCNQQFTVDKVLMEKELQRLSILIDALIMSVGTGPADKTLKERIAVLESRQFDVLAWRDKHEERTHKNQLRRYDNKTMIWISIIGWVVAGIIAIGAAIVESGITRLFSG